MIGIHFPAIARRWKQCLFANSFLSVHLLPSVCLLFVLGLATSEPRDVLAHQKPDQVPSDEVLASVDGEKITRGDVEFILRSRRMPKDRWEKSRKQIVEQLIDRRLVQAFLKERKFVADDAALKRRTSQIERLLKSSGDDPQKVLANLGFDDERLRNELALPLAWNAYVRNVVTTEQMREYFEKHRQELDGTEVRARQIFLKLDDPEDEQQMKAAVEKLQQIKANVESKKTTFEEAAGTHSQSPTSKQGGDVGFFPYRGRMPVEFTTHAFAQEKGTVGKPFSTQFGVHLVQVVDRRPGQFNLEDVREDVMKRLSDEEWNKLTAQLRKDAMIKYGQTKD